MLYFELHYAQQDLGAARHTALSLIIALGKKASECERPTWPLLPGLSAESMLMPEIPLDFRIAVSVSPFLDPFDASMGFQLRIG